MQTHLASCNYLILSLNNKTQEGRKKEKKKEAPNTNMQEDITLLRL